MKWIKDQVRAYNSVKVACDNSNKNKNWTRLDYNDNNS